MLHAERLTELALLTVGYWLIDLFVRQNGFWRMLERTRLNRLPHSEYLSLIPTFTLVWFWSWDDVPQYLTIRTLATGLLCLCAWKAVTRDVDPVVGETHAFQRIELAASCFCLFFSPVFLFAGLLTLTRPFRLWEHHATYPMRILQTLAAWVILATVVPTVAPNHFGDISTLCFFLTTMTVSHYIITAFAKMWLGPKWYSWVTDNYMHHLAANAWSWGWARFIPWNRWRIFINAVKRVEKPLQFCALALELGVPVVFLHPNLMIGFCISAALFHLGVFAVSGLLFWEWIATNLLLAWTVALLPATVTETAYGPGSLIAGVLFLIAFPLRHKLWKPMPLGWWDTPLTQRMHWIAEGESGTLYGIYNNFMCPHERLYGKVHACFMTPVAAFTYHLGEVWKHDLRDAIRHAGPNVDALNLVREKYGIRPESAQLRQNHLDYLQTFFARLNAGVAKQVLPGKFRWLKAPGDQVFYWGERPAYDQQEPVVRVHLIYREEYFDGEQLHRLHNETVEVVEIKSEFADARCTSEPTPKQIDDLLLKHGEGRIIDLPKLGGGFKHGDDGQETTTDQMSGSAA